MFLLDSTTPSILTVVLLGIGIVFVGLIVIIFMCKVLGWFVGATTKAEETKAPVATQAASAPATVSSTIENRGEVVAAISAAVAENLGKDVSAIRILSIKKV